MSQHLNKKSSHARSSQPKKKLPVDDAPHFVRHELHDHHMSLAHELLHFHHEADDKDTVDSSEPCHPLRSDKDVEQELIEIYENEDGTMPNMQQFDPKPRFRLLMSLLTFLGSLGFLAGAVWFGFFVFQPQSRFSNDDIIVSFSGDTEVQIGEEVHYRIRYRNAQSVPLTKTLMSIRYPEGFVFSDSSVPPTNDAKTEWSLGAIDAEGSGYIDIYGTLVGDVGKTQSFRIFFTYTPSNFSSEFQKVITHEVVLADTPVTLSIDGANTLVVGEEAAFSFDISPVQDASLVSPRFRIEPHEQFVLVRSEPAADSLTPYQWTFPSLSEKKTVTLYGFFQSPIDDKETQLFTAFVQGGSQQESFTYTKEIYTASVTEADISTTFVINGAYSDFTVQPGEVLNASITIKNNSDTDITQLRVRALFDSPSLDNKSMLHWALLEDKRNGGVFGEQLSPSVRRGTITWNQSSGQEFRSLAKGEEIVIDMSLPIKTAKDIALDDLVGSTISGMIDVQYEKNGAQQLYTSTPLVMTLVSDLALEVRDTVTPMEGTEVLHTIQWVLTNQFHALSDITLTADVYGDVALQGGVLQAPAGTATYDATTKKITWTIPSMPTTVDTLAMDIPLLLSSVNPTQTQLVSPVSLTATDTVTGQPLIVVGDAVLLLPSSTGEAVQ
jgi:hypothetical protein